MPANASWLGDAERGVRRKDPRSTGIEGGQEVQGGQEGSLSGMGAGSPAKASGTPPGGAATSPVAGSMGKALSSVTARPGESIGSSPFTGDTEPGASAAALGAVQQPMPSTSMPGMWAQGPPDDRQVMGGRGKRGGGAKGAFQDMMRFGHLEGAPPDLSSGFGGPPPIMGGPGQMAAPQASQTKPLGDSPRSAAAAGVAAPRGSTKPPLDLPGMWQERTPEMARMGGAPQRMSRADMFAAAQGGGGVGGALANQLQSAFGNAYMSPLAGGGMRQY